MSTKVKLCGMTRPEDILVVNKLKPDYVGFVFWPKSKRALTRDRAQELREMLSPDIPAVGVFVDEDPEVILSLVGAGIIQVVQLHGHETEETLNWLRERTDMPLWKAFKVRGPEDVAAANASSADLVLLDNGYGTGEPFDWTLMKDVRRPFLLAGGLTPENAEDAIGRFRPYGLDVSSGIETDGVKDPQKMTEFVRRVRRFRIQEETS